MSATQSTALSTAQSIMISTTQYNFLMIFYCRLLMCATKCARLLRHASSLGHTPNIVGNFYILRGTTKNARFECVLHFICLLLLNLFFIRQNVLLNSSNTTKTSTTLRFTRLSVTFGHLTYRKLRFIINRSSKFNYAYACRRAITARYVADYVLMQN